MASISDLLPQGVWMDRLDGEPVTLEIPRKRQTPEAAQRIFEFSSFVLTEEWSVRRKSSVDARKWLQSTSYAFLSATIDAGFAELFDERTQRLGRRRDRKGQRNPFQRGLMAVFAHDKNLLLNDKLRYYFGQRLWYAFRHYIPPEFVNGFLSEVWNNGGKLRAQTTAIEPRFERWVLAHLANDSARERRGEYDVRIQEALAPLRSVTPLLRLHHAQEVVAKRGHAR